MSSSNLPEMRAQFYPTIPRSEIIQQCKHQLPFHQLDSLGGAFAVAAAEIIKAAKNIPAESGEGLYRCVFPEGVSGALAKAKDGSGFLGAILDNGIVGQARWLPVEGATAAIPVDPVTLAVAVAMAGVNQKLNKIQENQQEILAFLRQSKESDLEGLVNSMGEILEGYRFNNDNSTWLASKLTIASGAKVKAEQNVIFYRKQITKSLRKQKTLHVDQNVDQMKSHLERQLKYYQMCLYLYAYSSFLEVVLGGNFKTDYLDHVHDKIAVYAFQYRQDYTDCYDQLEHYSKESIQSAVLKGLGQASRTAGEAIAKIPIIREGPVDEALIAAGKSLRNASKRHGRKLMDEFSENRDAGIQIFADSIDTINQMNNHPVELYFDSKQLYICA